MEGHPAMRDGNPEQWVAILDRILELDFETVIAGHGPVGNRRDVEQTRQYIFDLVATARLNPVLADINRVPDMYREWRIGKRLFR